jgi:hypothetical protein
MFGYYLKVNSDSLRPAILNGIQEFKIDPDPDNNNEAAANRDRDRYRDRDRKDREKSYDSRIIIFKISLNLRLLW